MKLHKEKNDSDTSQVLLERNQKPVPPVLFYIILFFVSILSCNSLTDNNNEGFTATLIMVSDNYPNGYKTHMGKLSYSRCITLLFSVKNTTRDSIYFPCSNSAYNDSCPKIRIYNGKRFVNTNCTHYKKRNDVIPANDSIVVAVRLWMSDLDSLGVNLDNEHLDGIIPGLSFCYIPESCIDGVLNNKNKVPCFFKSNNILYYYGNIYIDIKDGKETMKEMYDKSDLNVIRKIPITNSMGRGDRHLPPRDGSSICSYDPPTYKDDLPKSFFILYGKDSLLMIPDFAISNLYGSVLEPYHLLFFNYQTFENAFLYSKKLFSQRLYWSYHIKLNKKIINDYNQMSFDDFKRRYWVINGNDTLLLMKDTTLAYLFDKHGYYCIFNYQNTGKNKIIKMNTEPFIKTCPSGSMQDVQRALLE